jgi:hypothetical protein
MRKKYILSHQVENAEQLLGRLMRGAGMSQDREGWANRLIGLGDYAAAEQLRAATPTIAISDLDGFREPFSVLFQQLQTASVFDAVVDEMIQAPIRSQIISGDHFALFEVVEGAAIPFASSALEDLGELPLVKVGALLAFTIEFLRGLTAEVDNTLNNAFLRAIAAATDAALIRRLAENAGPAIPASSSLAADLKAGAEFILNRKSGRLHLIVGPRTALEIALATNMNGEFLFPGFDVNTGGILGGIQTHISDQIGDDSSGERALLFDASRVVANRGSIDVQRSENAVAQMRDDPLNGHATVVSAYQTNTVFLRILRTFGLKVPDNETIAAEFSGVGNWFGED